MNIKGGMIVRILTAQSARQNITLINVLGRVSGMIRQLERCEWAWPLVSHVVVAVLIE